MANRHFGKLADVWKHLPLVEILAIDSPLNYWESHAGSGAYAVADDAERRYGALRFFDVAKSVPALAASRYLFQLGALNPSSVLTLYPGSALLAMRELGARGTYVLCDVDPTSARDLTTWATRENRVAQVVASDGNETLYDKATTVDDLSDVFVHVDPYDPWLAGTTGVCAIDLAATVASRGGRLMYWYGYSDPDDRAWAFDVLAERARGSHLWCGDIMVTSSGCPSVRSDGDLGAATTPGTGFGIVTASVSSRAVAACESLGEALRLAYEDATLPEGGSGRLDFTVRSVA